MFDFIENLYTAQYFYIQNNVRKEIYSSARKWAGLVSSITQSVSYGEKAHLITTTNTTGHTKYIILFTRLFDSSVLCGDENLVLSSHCCLGRVGNSP